MLFTIDDSFLPATLTAPPMTDEQFAEFCAENPDYFFEAKATGEIIVTPPRFSIMGVRNSEIAAQLGNWATNDCKGVAIGSSASFLFPNGARRSPDASWTPKAAMRNLPEQSRETYWHLCPPFVIELRSHSDRLPVLREKMEEYVANGAQLGWLIDPETRAVEIYRPDRAPETLTAVDSVSGEGPVEGFILDLRRVWDPLAG